MFKRYKTCLLWSLFGVFYFYGLWNVWNSVHFFSPANLSCVNLIIRPVKEPGREEGKIFLPLKTLILRKTEGRRRRGRQDKMVGWHHPLNGRAWANSGRYWRTGKPGVLQSMGSRTGGRDWTTASFGVHRGTLTVWLYLLRAYWEILGPLKNAGRR